MTSDSYLDGMETLDPPTAKLRTDQVSGAIVLAHALRVGGPKRALVVLYTEQGVRADTVQRLQVSTLPEWHPHE